MVLLSISKDKSSPKVIAKLKKDELNTWIKSYSHYIISFIPIICH